MRGWLYLKSTFEYNKIEQGCFGCPVLFDYVFVYFVVAVVVDSFFKLKRT